MNTQLPHSMAGKSASNHAQAHACVVRQPHLFGLFKFYILEAAGIVPWQTIHHAHVPAAMDHYFSDCRVTIAIVESV